MTLPIIYPLGLAALLFGVGLWGAVTHRNGVRVLMFIEIMLTAVNLNLVTFYRYFTPTDARGMILTLFVMTVSAAEASVGLAIILSLVRNRGSVNVENINLLKG